MAAQGSSQRAYVAVVPWLTLSYAARQLFLDVWSTALLCSPWQVLMEATTDAATPLNLAQHTYFNLNGEANGTVLDHYLQLSSCALMCCYYPVGRKVL